MLKKHLVLLITCVLVLIPGCQAKKNTTPAPITSTITSQTTLKSESQKTTTGNAEQPKQLQTIETDSEDIMDDISNNDWTKAQAKIVEMKSSLSELKPLLESAKVSSSFINGVQTALTSLEKQVAAKKAHEAKVQANAIRKFIPDIADSFQTKLPTDLARLDYLGREIILNFEGKDWTSAKSNFTNGKEIWTRVKNKLGSSNSDIAKYDESLNNIGNYINNHDATAATKEINTLLDKLNVLENGF
jgi:archaellum component FlaC